ncbi:hypothetical protein ABC795_13095 [Blastococcus sp. HT6-30]|uniref:hypothetical protein n=1 Tax=Blastococcus sp. HT6-30 TaxID=3144843 RepID=UPI00321AF224
MAHHPRRGAGAFDVRDVIAELIGFYGVVLLIVGLLDGPEEAPAEPDGSNADLWAGLAMVAVAVAFAVWTRLRPAVVEAPAPDDERGVPRLSGRRGKSLPRRRARRR